MKETDYLGFNKGRNKSIRKRHQVDYAPLKSPYINLAQSRETQSDLKSSKNRSDTKTELNVGASPYDEELIRELMEFEEAEDKREEEKDRN